MARAVITFSANVEIDIGDTNPDKIAPVSSQIIQVHSMLVDEMDATSVEITDYQFSIRDE